MARALVFATLAAAAVSAAPLAAAASKGAPCTKPRVIHSLPKGFAGSFYVSLAGNDSFSGTLPTPSADGSDGPFLTPGAAAAAVQTLPRPFTSDVRVQLRGGVYPLATTLTLGPGSGGDGMDAKVRWSSYDADGPGSAVISGGVALTGWQQTATAGVWVAPLPSAAADRSRGLFVRGERRWPARVPAATGPARSDWASDASTLHYVDTLDGCGFHPSTCFGTCGNASHAINDWGVVYNSSDSRGPSPAWVDIPGIDMLSFAAWTAAWAPLAAIVAHNTTILTAAPLSSARPGAFGGLGCPSGARYILWNVYEALAPGSFYINDTSRTIMYSLLPGEDPAALDAVVPVLPTVVRVQGDDCGGPVAWLSIEGLNISYAAEMSRVTSHSSTGAVTLSSATDVALTHLDISACDGSGVLLLDVLTRLVVDHCSVRDVGGDGFGIDFGRSYQSTNTTIRDSVIDGVGFIFLNQPGGIRIMGDPSGVAVIEHNLVRDSPYAGIMVGWQDGATRPPEPVAWQFIVRANVVEAIGNEVLSDFGGIYISTSGEQCEGTESCYLPTLVEGNLVRDVRGYNYGGEGVYLDENVAGVYITQNAVGNVSGAAVYIHCGLNQSVVNNIVWAGHELSGRSFKGASGLVGFCNTGGVEPRYTNVSAVIDTNVFLVANDGATLFNEGQFFGHVAFERNVYWALAPLNASALLWPGPGTPSSGWRSWAQWQADGFDAGSAVADPLLQRLDGSDFQLLAGSPALRRGFLQLQQGWGPRAA